MSRASHRPIHAQTSTHSRAEQSPAPAHHGGTMGPGILLISKLSRPPQRALAALGLLRSLLFHPALRRSGAPAERSYYYRHVSETDVYTYTASLLPSSSSREK
jgi:hypothetical protein